MYYKITPAKLDDMLAITDLVLSVNGDIENLKVDEFLVAKNEYNILGCGRLKHYSTCVEVASIAVYPEYRQMGIASNIIKNLVEQTTEKLYLICEKSLMPFFNKFGFQEDTSLIHKDLENKYLETYRDLLDDTRVMVRV